MSQVCPSPDGCRAKVLQVLTWFLQHDISCLQLVSCFSKIIVCVLCLVSFMTWYVIFLWSDCIAWWMLWSSGMKSCLWMDECTCRTAIVGMWRSRITWFMLVFCWCLNCLMIGLQYALNYLAISWSISHVAGLATSIPCGICKFSWLLC